MPLQDLCYTKADYFLNANFVYYDLEFMAVFLDRLVSIWCVDHLSEGFSRSFSNVKKKKKKKEICPNH